MNRSRWVWLLVPIVLFMVPFAGASSGGHYIPQAGDEFHYYESTVLDNGSGGFTGYTENQFINGSIAVTGVLPNGTENATYQYTTHWENSTGSAENYPSQGNFTFSADTFHYVQGTDNETGYTNPYVWFYMNNSLARGSTFYILNTPFSVVSTNTSYPLSSSSTGYVTTIYAEGNGSYAYSNSGTEFTATYNWKMYFDPATGYEVGYVYTEQDSDGQGDTYTYTDSLHVTSTSYPLTPGAAPPPSPPSTGSSSSNSTGLIEVVAVVVIALVIVVAIIAVLMRSRRNTPLPRHSAQGNVGFGTPPGGSPPPISLIPSQQPAVQQVVLRDTVKVNCKYCGTLIDSTVTNCPNCGAARD